MKRLVTVASIVVFSASFLFGAHAAVTVDPPHFPDPAKQVDPSAGYSCASCHSGHLTLGSTGYNNICSACHRPGDPAAGARPLNLADEANPFGAHSTTGISRQYQTSHRWSGPDTVPSNAAQPPVQAAMTTSSLRARTGGQLACVRCHNQHSNTHGSFLRMANDRDQLCLDCHRSRNVDSHRQGSHPVNINYDTARGSFNHPPRNANPANPSSDLNARLDASGRIVLCSTCHGVHFTDSRSGTLDARGNFAHMSSGDGFLLHTDRRGATVAAGQPDNLNICTNCHDGKKNHNLKGQDIQCVDCHGAHVEYDPLDPSGSNGRNIELIRRSVPAGTTGSGRIFFRYTGSQREYKNSQNSGVCQGCHAVPASGGIYPLEHDSSDPRVCNSCHAHNSSNGSFSGACTACHGYPPSTATLGGPTGLAVPPTGATPASPGAHVTHAKNKFMACITCHTGYAAKAMPSASIDIGFAINGNNFPGFGGDVSGGTFNATALNSGYSWSVANGTTLTTSNSAVSCNVYCHGATLTGGSIAAPTWTIADGSQKACGTCHGVTAASAPVTGGHTRHAGNGATGLALPCASCHGIHSNNDHVNGSVSWDLSDLPGGGGFYKGAQAGATGGTAPSTAFGACSNLYCHSPGTSLQAPFATPRVTPAWGGAALGCDSCHDGTASGPSYPNGSPKANSHFAHVVTIGYGCDICHFDTTTTGISITTSANHVNRVFNLAPNRLAGVNYTATVGTPGSPSACAAITCHGGNSAGWGQTLGCQACHLGGVDTDVLAPPFTKTSITAVLKSTEWATSGHGRTTGTYISGNPAANFTGVNSCLYCHDSTIAHNNSANPFRLRNITDPAWNKNGTCMVCHAIGSAGVTVDGVLRNATVKVESRHYGYAHTAILNAGQFCWDCHDGHGDSNIYMIHDKISDASDATTGAPKTFPQAQVVFLSAAIGSDYAKSSPPFNGICNVCHTVNDHYSKTSGDGHNAGTRCTNCHRHNGPTQDSAFTPGGGTCDACHGYPPAAPGFRGAQNNWSSALPENYPGGGGAHTVSNHVSKQARASEGFANCSRCHNPADHVMSPIVFRPSTNIKVRLSQELRYEPAQQARYSSNRLNGAQHQPGTCTNISCHFGATPAWNQK